MPTMCQVALGQGVGDVGKLAAVVTVLQRADIHVAPLLQLFEPCILLLALTVRVQHDAHPQRTCGTTRREQSAVTEERLGEERKK